MAPLIALAYKMKDIQLMNYLLNLKLDLSASCDKTTFINTICNDKNSKTSKKNNTNIIYVLNKNQQ